MDGWEVVVHPVEAPLGSIFGGRFDFGFQTDLIDELRGARGIDARTPDADELGQGARSQTLYVDAGVRPGPSERIYVEVRAEPGGPVVWEREYPAHTSTDVDSFIDALIRDIARDVAAVVRAAATAA